MIIMNPDLIDFRKSLDNIDDAIIFLLAERFRITTKVGEYKKNKKMKPVDSVRESQQFARIEKLAEQAGLNPAFATSFLRLIINEVVKNHIALRE